MRAELTPLCVLGIDPCFFLALGVVWCAYYSTRSERGLLIMILDEQMI